jgi:xanthine/uracil/vitamin C permease (AzgA family)
VFISGKPFLPSVLKHFSLLGPFVSYKAKEALWKQSLLSYSQQFIFFITLWMGTISHSVCPLETFPAFRLLGPFMSYEANEVLWIWFLMSYSQHFIFFIMGPISYSVVLSLLGSIVRYKAEKLCDYGPKCKIHNTSFSS